MTCSKDIDGGWAWVVLACGMGVLFITGFLAYSGGIMTAALLEIFEEDLSWTATVPAIVSGFMCSTGPLAGFIINRFGCRTCTILGGIISTIGLSGASFSNNLFTVMWTYGMLTGLGYGLSYTSAIVKVGLNFHRMRPLAAGITVAGAGIGMFAGPPVIQVLIDHYGLRGSFLIAAGISSHFCVLGSLMRPLPNNNAMKSSTVRTNNRSHRRSLLTNCFERLRYEATGSLHIFKNVRFMMYLWSTFCWNVAESAAFLHLPTYCIKQGSTKSEAAFLFAVMGIANICSRILTGFTANDEKISTVTILFGQMSIAGVCTGLFPLYSMSYRGQVLYAAVLGIYTSGANSLMSPIAVELVGLEDLATAFGLVSLLAGAGYLTGPPIAGAIVDYGATYTESFIFAGAMYIMSGLAAIFIPLFHAEKNKPVISVLHGDVSLEVVNEKTACIVETKHDTERVAEDQDNEKSFEMDPL